MRFPILWYVRPARSQIIQRIRAVGLEPLHVPCIFFECQATELTAFRVFKLKENKSETMNIFRNFIFCF